MSPRVGVLDRRHSGAGEEQLLSAIEMDASGHVLAAASGWPSSVRLAVKSDTVGHTVRIETEVWR
jgi:hypothetical protein